MNNKSIELNTKIFSGDINNCENLELLINKNIGIICDKNFYINSKKIQEFIKGLNKSCNVFYYDYDYKFEPSYQLLDSLMSTINDDKGQAQIDYWIGIGGGSAMDTAKGLAFLSNNKGESIKYKGFPSNCNKPVPVIAIPTTTGTGSEVVFNASFIDEDSKVKMGINDNDNYPVLAILDPELVSGAPSSVLASSGVDALVHALESFTSKKSNHITRVFSIKAFHLIMENMPQLLAGKGDFNNWSNMQWAAVFAMMGLSNTTSGPTGALSYYLGSNFNVPHGIAGGSFIGKVCTFNHKKGYHEYSKLAGWKNSLDLHKLNSEEKSYYVVSQINELLKKCNMPKSLKELGVLDNQFEGFFDFANNAKPAFNFNPISISEEEYSKIIN